MPFPLTIQDMPYVDLCSGLEHPAKMEEKLSKLYFASYTAKRHQLVCWQASISVDCWWCLQGFCMPFPSFGTELLIAALRFGLVNEYWQTTV